MYNIFNIESHYLCLKRLDRVSGRGWGKCGLIQKLPLLFIPCITGIGFMVLKQCRFSGGSVKPMYRMPPCCFCAINFYGDILPCIMACIKPAPCVLVVSKHLNNPN